MDLRIGFDSDGTLVDSLIPHAQFCRDVNEQRGLGLILPDVNDRDAWRRLSVAPMDNFLAKVGFPKELVPEITQFYEDTFSRNYPQAMFPGAADLVRDLKEKYPV